MLLPIEALNYKISLLMAQVIATGNLDIQHQVIANAQEVVMIKLLNDEHNVLSCPIHLFMTHTTTKDSGSFSTTGGDFNLKDNLLGFSGSEYSG
jgi:ribose/xylose/arabinose/galactoside ABC-type transport system permease subunit